MNRSHNVRGQVDLTGQPPIRLRNFNADSSHVDTVHNNNDGSRDDNPEQLLSEAAKENKKVDDVQQPVNIRLSDKRFKLAPVKLVPRRYQSELYEQASKENVIIYLGTGLGKTYIIVLFLNSPFVNEQIRHYNRRIVFLAPTQDLVKQQAEYVNRQVPYSCKVYCGRTGHCGKHIDHWDKIIWEQELKDIELLFMTPQIFSSATSTNILDWQRFAAVIFDECHHAARNKNGKETGSGYTSILHHYRLKFKNAPAGVVKPRIIGLTASLINNMPKTRETIPDTVRYLEEDFTARCVTDLTAEESRPIMVIHSHNESLIEKRSHILSNMFDYFKKDLEEVLELRKISRLIHSQVDTLCSEDKMKLDYSRRLKVAAMGISIKPKAFPKVIFALQELLKKCGLWTMNSQLKMVLDLIEKSIKSRIVSGDIRALYEYFAELLNCIKESVDEFLNQDANGGLLWGRPQAKALLKVLTNEYERSKNDSDKTFSCLIFVRRRIEVLALNSWLQTISKTLPEYNFIKSDYALGLAGAPRSGSFRSFTQRKPIEQSKMLNDFRDGKVNVVVTTSVLEEGIDLPVCSTVVRYDFPNTFREYVQSRGRSRQSVSSFVAITTDVTKTKDLLNKFNDFELSLRDHLKSRDIGTLERASFAASDKKTRNTDSSNSEWKEDFYMAEENNIFIKPATAKIILNMYWHSVAKSRPFAEDYKYEYVDLPDGRYQTTIYLPSFCSLSSKRGIVGNIKRSRVYADDSAAVQVFKVLFEAGELDKNGVPIRRVGKNIESILDENGLRPNYDQLDPKLLGECVEVNGKVVHYFEPRICNLENYISKDCSMRTYKLIRLIFKPEREARQETREFFEQPTFGIIVDSSISDNFIPDTVYSHYGSMEVRYEIVESRVTITNFKDHRDYLNYTFRLLRNCLSIGGFSKEDFRRRCQFYIVPLVRANNQPDSSKLRYSFTGGRTDIKVGDIVRRGAIYRDQRNSYYSDQLMLVKRIHYNMNAHSQVTRASRTTFLDDARHKFGPDVRVKIDQPVIEVMPIAREFARIKMGKKTDRNHSTDGIFFLEQFLEHFDDDCCDVMQAFNLPEIIDRLYRLIGALELDSKFQFDTRSRRDEAKLSQQANIGAVELNIDREQEEPSDDLDQEEQLIDNETPPVAGDELCEDGPDSDSDEDDDFFPDSEEDSTDDTDSLLDEDECKEFGRVAKDYKICEASRYTATGLRTLDYEYKDTYDSEPHFDDEATSPIFKVLKEKSSPIYEKLTKMLESYKLKLNTDGIFEGEDNALSKRTKVVTPLEPTIKFDRIHESLNENVSRELSVLEALTLSRAQESYNLESLENIGDSYLKYVTSIILFGQLNYDEGILTTARSMLTCNRHFNQLAKKRKLGFSALTKPFTKDFLPFLFGRRINHADKTKVYNRLREKDLADIFEAIVGSYLLYHGDFEAILAVEWLGLPIIKEHTFDEFHSNAVVFKKPPTASLSDYDSEKLRSYESKLEGFSEIIGYTFNDPYLIVQAFTHSSALNKCTASYERLEFLGDAILDYLVTRTLALEFKNDFTPGQMTNSRSSIVNNYNFARLALEYRYDFYIQHGSPDLLDMLTQARLALEENPDMCFLNMIEFDSITKLLGDVFESVAGAIYLDSGCSLDSLWSVYYPMLKPAIEREVQNPTKNPIALLYETFPDRVSFEKIVLKDLDDNKFSIKCIIKDYGEFPGVGMSSKQAKLRAVELALKDAPPPPAVQRRGRRPQRGNRRDACGSRHASRGRMQHNRNNNYLGNRYSRKF